MLIHYFVRRWPSLQKWLKFKWKYMLHQGGLWNNNAQVWHVIGIPWDTPCGPNWSDKGNHSAQRSFGLGWICYHCDGFVLPHIFYYYSVPIGLYNPWCSILLRMINSKKKTSEFLTDLEYPWYRNIYGSWQKYNICLFIGMVCVVKSE